MLPRHYAPGEKYLKCEAEFLEGVKTRRWASVRKYIAWALTSHRGLSKTYLRDISTRDGWAAKALSVQMEPRKGIAHRMTVKAGQELNAALELLDGNALEIAKRTRALLKKTGPNAPTPKDLDSLGRTTHLTFVDVTARLKPTEDGGFSGQIHFHNHYSSAPYASLSGQVVVDGGPGSGDVGSPPPPTGEPDSDKQRPEDGEDRARDAHPRPDGFGVPVRWRGMVRGTNVPPSANDHVGADEHVAGETAGETPAGETERH